MTEAETDPMGWSWLGAFLGPVSCMAHQGGGLLEW